MNKKIRNKNMQTGFPFTFTVTLMFLFHVPYRNLFVSKYEQAYFY